MLYNIIFFYPTGAYAGEHRKLSAAQLGGHIAHLLLEDYGAFIVSNSETDRILMRYNRKGLR